MPEILEKITLAPKIHEFKFWVPRIVKKARAGQFVILRIDENGERIPMSIAGLDLDKGILTIVVLEVGKSTAHLGTLKSGDFVQDIIGPLGIPTEMGQYGTVVLIGGGIGIAPLLPLIQAFKSQGNRVITIIGARSKDLVIKEKELGELADKIIVTTDDGSRGQKGFVTDALRDLLVVEGQSIGLAMAVGPVVMMQAVSDLTRQFGVKTLVSLNPIMVDGTGMCGGCRVSINGVNKFVCVDGPDFDGHQVDFELLLKRQKSYLTQERIAMERFSCRATVAVEVVA